MGVCVLRIGEKEIFKKVYDFEVDTRAIQELPNLCKEKI